MPACSSPRLYYLLTVKSICRPLILCNVGFLIIRPVFVSVSESVLKLRPEENPGTLQLLCVCRPLCNYSFLRNTLAGCSYSLFQSNSLPILVTQFYLYECRDHSWSVLSAFLLFFFLPVCFPSPSLLTCPQVPFVCLSLSITPVTHHP